MTAFPYVPQATPAAPVIPYLTLSEFNTAATSLDVGELVPLGTPGQQQAALAQKIAAASSWADRICHQILAATSDTETASGLFVRSDGTVLVPLRYWPVLEVTAVSVGPRVGSLTTLTDTTNLDLTGRNGAAGPLAVPLIGAGTLNTITPTLGRSWAGRAYAAVTYVNGWANTTMAASTTAGATVLPVWSTFGFYTGRTYRLVDPYGGTEQFTVVSIAPGTLHTSPLVYDHHLPAVPDGISVTGLPESVKQAVVLLTAQLIKTRGAEAIVMDTIGGQPSKLAPSDSGGFDDYHLACDLLSEYERVA